MLCATQDGWLVPLATTTTDAAKRFAFEHLPVGPYREYLPGANRDDVYYPGRHVQLVADHPQAGATAGKPAR